MYWAKNDNPQEYRKIKNQNIDTFVERSIKMQLIMILLIFYSNVIKMNLYVQVSNIMNGINFKIICG